MSDRLARGSVVTGTVVDHRPYGLLVALRSGEIGLVDRAMIDDVAVAPGDWPAVGSAITVVGAGYTSAGQLRLSARPSHLARDRQS